MHRLGKFADPPPKDDLYNFDNGAGGQPIGPPIIWDPKNPQQDIDPPTFRGYTYSGIVRDAYSEQPLAGATVALIKNNQVVAKQAANGRGQFQIDMNQPVDYIQITEASHKQFIWPASEVQHTFDLEPDQPIGPPVLLPPGGQKKDNSLILLLGAFAFAKWQNWI